MMVPDEEELIPTTKPWVVVGIADKEPVPVDAPMVLGVTVPTFTLPAVVLMPQRTPLVVEAPLEVARLSE